MLVDHVAGLFGMLILPVLFGAINVTYVVGSPARTVFLSLFCGFDVGLVGVVAIFRVMKPEFQTWVKARLETRTAMHRVFLRHADLLIEGCVILREKDA